MPEITLPPILSSEHELLYYRQLCAEIAYGQFMANLDCKIYQHNQNKAEQYVSLSVYGATQAGKTTLILDLLGIDPTQAATVQKVLRGRQKHGKSATARVLRYRKSDNEYWYIGGEKQTDDDAACSKFAEIRQEMEQLGVKTSDDHIDILIPKQFFRSDSKNSASTVIYDLPGADAGNENERKYVSELKEKYIQRSDLVLLVCSVNDMGSLFEDSNNASRRNDPALENWHLNPMKYKVVCTRVFSDESIKKILRPTNLGGDEPQKKQMQELCNHIAEQFNRFEGKYDLADIIYTFESGDSWEGLKADKDYFQIVEPLRQESIEKLNRIIAESTHFLARLHQGFQIEKTARLYLNAKEQQYKKEKTECNCNIASIEDSNKLLGTQIKCLEELSKTHTTEINELEKLLDKIKNRDDNQDSQSDKYIYFLKKFREDIEKVNHPKHGKKGNVETLKQSWAIQQQKLKKTWDGYIQELRSYYIDSPHHKPNPEYPDAYAMKIVYRELHNRPWYNLWGSYVRESSFRKDEQKLIDAIKSQQEELINKLTELVEGLVKFNKKKAEKEKKKKIHEIERAEQELSNNKQKIEGWKQKQKGKDKEFEIYKKLRENDIDYGKKFIDFIENKYQLFISDKVYPNFLNTSSATQKLAWVILVRLIKQDLENIKGKGLNNA